MYRSRPSTVIVIKTRIDTEGKKKKKVIKIIIITTVNNWNCQHV